MPGAKVFSILDAKCGFWQIPLDEASSKLTTFMTPSGRYRFLRMPYGISTGSEVFQRTMEHLFDRQPFQIVLDDILVWGCTLQQHDERLKQVLHKIRASNMKLNPDKCKFRVTSVSYVGHLLTADGIKPDPDKTAAVRQMPKPEDKQALQRFLGMTNYLSKFIPLLTPCRWSRMDTKHGCSSTTELVIYLPLGARLTAFRVPAPHTPELPAHSKQHQP